MKKFLSLLVLAALNVPVFCQPTLSNFYTLYVETDDSHFDTLLTYQKTIGVYPQTAVSCYEATASGVHSGFLTINRDAQTCTTYSSYNPRIFIRDLFQLRFSDTVYFCGVTMPPNTNDSIGIMGYFIINQDGTLGQSDYLEIPEVNAITHIIPIQNDTSCEMAALGRKRNGNTEDYYFINGHFAYPMNYASYYYSLINHVSTPTDFVSAGNYIALISQIFLTNSFFVRKFDKYSLNSGTKDYIYEYPTFERVVFGPKSTFIGFSTEDTASSSIAVAYMGQEEFSGYWKTGLKIVDLSTMSVTNAQEHAMAEKNELFGITYLATHKKLALLDFFKPDYSYFNSTVVIFDPFLSAPYISTVFYSSDYFKNIRSISKLYESTTSVEHFLCGNVFDSGKSYMVHNVSHLNPIDCLETDDISIRIPKKVDPNATQSPLTRQYSSTIIKHLNMVQYSENNNVSCQEQIR